MEEKIEFLDKKLSYLLDDAFDVDVGDIFDDFPEDLSLSLSLTEIGSISSLSDSSSLIESKCSNSDEVFVANLNNDNRTICRKFSQQSKKSKKTSKVEISVPSTLSRARIAAKSFQHLMSESAKAFNTGDIPALAQLIHDHTHNRCLFRVRDPLQTSDYSGCDSIVRFYDALLLVFPDGVMLSKKVTSSDVKKFKVIQTKIDLVGTRVSKEISKSVFCPNVDGNPHEVDFMVVPPEERQKYIDLEKSIISTGRRVHVTIKAIVSHYLDMRTGRIVFTDVAFKVKSFRPA